MRHASTVWHALLVAVAAVAAVAAAVALLVVTVAEVIGSMFYGV